MESIVLKDREEQNHALQAFSAPNHQRRNLAPWAFFVPQAQRKEFFVLKATTAHHHRRRHFRVAPVSTVHRGLGNREYVLQVIFALLNRADKQSALQETFAKRVHQSLYNAPSVITVQLDLYSHVIV